ncbi:MAG: site-specific DNA-methyltransferase, partial [Lachnospiraceae bacterium]|nr:site-specific DNA-methyltransferase [Lachnospiraceae bacterium]
MPNPKQELAVIKERMLKAGIPEDECAGILKPLEAELARRVCGLVWEPKDTSVPQMAGRMPAFIRQDDMCVTGTGGTDNILIEGENLYALMGLQYTHTDENGNGLIDIIYIDPPYNTESTDFAYNDKFEKSEWLSMMETRLKLGRNLLNEKGVIFISINDKFHSQLKLLCDDIFGSSNFLADMIWRSTPGSNTGTDIKKVTEYVLCYEKSFGKAATGVRKSINEESYTLEDEYVKRRGRYKTNKLDRRMTGQHYSEALNYPIKMPDGTLLYPGCTDQKQKNWNWRWSAEKVEWGKKHGFIIFNRNEKTKAWSIYFKQYLKVDNTDTVIERYQPYQNLIENVEGVSSSTGTGDLENIVGGKVFDYPKPVNLIKYLLEIHTNPDAVVLDFFAGSGTTGQAVLE